MLPPTKRLRGRARSVACCLAYVRTPPVKPFGYASSRSNDHRPQTTDHGTTHANYRWSSVVGRQSSGTTRALIQGRSAGRHHQRVVLGTYPLIGAGIVTGVTSVPGLGNYPRALELRIENCELRIGIVVDACFSPFYILHSQFRWPSGGETCTSYICPPFRRPRHRRARG